MVISSVWLNIRLDIWLFSVSGTQLGIRQAKSGVWPDTGYQKKAGYPVHP
jgi:hypothetical protein